MLRRLKALGASNAELMEVFQQQVATIAELAAPAWSSMLTNSESRQLERLQKTACHVVLGSQYTTYKRALTQLGMSSMADRRARQSRKFARKCANNEKFKNWFVCNEEKTSNTRSKIQAYKQPYTRTLKYANSAIPAMTAALNSEVKVK